MGTLVLRGALVAAIALAAVAVAVEKSRSSHPLARSAEAALLDTDGDGYPDVVETYVGTNPNSACGVESWPPDVDNDGAVTILDLAKVASAYGSSVANGDPRYKARYDMDADASISILDLSKMASKFGKRCTDLFPYPANSPEPPNGDFEVADYTPGKPLYWTKVQPPTFIGADYQFRTGTPHTGLSYVSADVYGIDVGGCTFDGNGWKTESGVPINMSKTYQLSFFAKSDILISAGETVEPGVVIEYDDVSGNPIGLSEKGFLQTGVGSWELFTPIIGSGGDFVPPAGTKSIKIVFISENFVAPTTTCTVGTSYARESFDSVSLVDVSTFTPTPTATFTPIPTATPTPTPTP